MYAEPKKNHLKNQHISCLDKGPMFFTAPHSKKLNRGGKDYGEKLRIHKREIFTSFLAADFARGTGSNSYMVWGVSNVVSQTDIDPNYLMKKHFSSSAFHQSLHKWALTHPERPIFHVDVHGKMDRSHNCEVDVGLACMEAHWHKDPLANQIKQFFSQYEKIFKGMKFGGFQCKFQCNPDLHGYWGGGIHTMTEQAILLGIPSLQFEIPFSVRKKLFKDQELRGRFHKLLVDLYERVITPDFQKRQRKQCFDRTIADKFIPTVGTGKQQEEAYSQLKAWQTKEEASNNGNKKCI